MLREARLPALPLPQQYGGDNSLPGTLGEQGEESHPNSRAQAAWVGAEAKETSGRGF